jgi:AbrB family looped-hinge helix DNA binding protein
VIAMRVGARGQVVIPVDVRRQAGIGAGDEVEVSFNGEHVVVVLAGGAPTRGQRMVNRLRGRGGTAVDTAGMSTDELMALLRD